MLLRNDKNGGLTNVYSNNDSKAELYLQLLGLGAKSEIAKQHRDFAPNPERPPNPFSPPVAPDWLPFPIVSGLNESTQSRARNNGLRGLASSGPVRSPSMASTSLSPITQMKPAPPPVPRKPVLSSKSSKQVDTSAATGSGLGNNNGQALEQEQEMYGQHPRQLVPTLPIRRENIMQEAIQPDALRHRYSKLPPSERGSGSTLMDEKPYKLSSIPALEPLRRDAL